MALSSSSSNFNDGVVSCCKG